MPEPLIKNQYPGSIAKSSLRDLIVILADLTILYKSSGIASVQQASAGVILITLTTPIHILGSYPDFMCKEFLDLTVQHWGSRPTFGHCAVTDSETDPSGKYITVYTSNWDENQSKFILENENFSLGIFNLLP